MNRSNDMADGERFLRDLEEAADGIDCDKEWTHGSVLRGEHEGGGAATAVAIPAANNAANNKKRNLRTKRLQKTATWLKKHLPVSSDLKVTLTNAAPGDGEAMWPLDGSYWQVGSRTAPAVCATLKPVPLVAAQSEDI